MPHCHRRPPAPPGLFSPLGTLLLSALVAGAASATPIPKKLSADLRELAEKRSAPAAARALAPSAQSPEEDAVALDQESIRARDEQGRVRVKILLDGSKTLAELQTRMEGIAGTRVAAVSDQYRAGVIEAFVPEEQLVEVAKTAGVLSVVSSSPAVYDVGATTSQGVVQHRVDKLPNRINGKGITVGVMSDSYDTRVRALTHAADDVASGDLPGTGNPLGNTSPVVVLEDSPRGTDEGRAMLQIVHDLAPGARLGFATANGGEVAFANNIRSLAGLPNAPNAVAGFKADVIVDDVIYPTEPFFQDGIVAQAVDDAAAAGVSYFSSAGNRPGTMGYDSQFRLVPDGPDAAAGTNIKLSQVPAALYAGGFHNFAPAGSPQDIAQTIMGGGTISFQWNEPYDPTPPTLGAILAQGSGTTTPAAPTEDFHFTSTAGQVVAITADADPASPNPISDVTISLRDPSGVEVAFEDSTTNPEVLFFRLTVSGTYTVQIGGFRGATGGFVFKVQESFVSQRVLTDFNLLIFWPNGDFLGAVAEDNTVTNRPVELSGLPAGTWQLVIARSNTPPSGSRAADRIRYVMFFAGGPQEYFNYNGPVTFGHNSARGATGVAAYAFYPPFIPEAFTSPGPSTIYFDKHSNPLRRPEQRLKPDLAAMDGANNTFFGTDDALQDDDTFPNFFGTSAAAPHAAAVAALTLQAAGGPGHLKPKSVRRLLQRTTFPHDLDPNFSAGIARNGRHWVTVSANADQNAISQFDPNVFTVGYFGPGSLASITLKPITGNQTETPTKGIVFDTRTAGGQPFVLGTLGGLTPADLTSSFSLPADPPAAEGQFKELTVTIAPGAMTSGKFFRFGVDRDEADAFGPVNGAAGGNGADLLGQGVLLPEGTVTGGGATFDAVLTDGTRFTGTIKNQIGHGYSVQDGFGFINAQRAVAEALEHRDDDDDEHGDSHDHEHGGRDDHEHGDHDDD